MKTIVILALSLVACVQGNIIAASANRALAELQKLTDDNYAFKKGARIGMRMDYYNYSDEKTLMAKC